MTNDAARFEALYRSTRSDLLRYLTRRSATPEAAADLLAETYLVAWEKLDRLPAGDQARLWLFGVARNLSKQQHRRSRVADALVERLSAELRSLVASGQPTRDDELLVALDTLSPLDREVITLAAWEELSPRETAQVLGMSVNAVRIRLHRTRKRLRRQLAETASQEPGRTWSSAQAAP